MSPAETFVGVLERRGRFFVAEPLFGPRRGERARGQVTADPGKGRAGDLVLLSVEGRRQRARVIRRLGRPDVARDVLEGLMLDRGLRRRFDPVIEQAAADARGSRDGRRDLRGLATFTIDPAAARDFDDAISAERIDADRVRVWVHIADVASFVGEGSPVDSEARRRATSVYVPGAVEPMLPPALSNESCSLVPGAERLAVSVEMEFFGADVVNAAFARSLICSNERLDYARVDRIFAGSERAGAPWGEALEAAREVSRALGARRATLGALEIVSSEPEFGFDDNGHVASIAQGVQSESHALIEHLMIAANEQVAKLLDKRSLPALYRVHEQPDPERVERLVEQLDSLGIPTPPVPEHLSGTQAAELVGALSVAVDRHVRSGGSGRLALTSLVLRSLKQAYYSPRNVGHAGLRSPRYCHFTSPIRRYPDLVCHRALLAGIGADEPAPAARELSDLGEWCSFCEREAMSVERAADDVARAFALQREPAERAWSGEITGLIGAGAFVAFGDGFEGMLPARGLGGGWWELNEPGTILHNVRGSGTMRLGDPVSVRVRRVDAPRGRVDLELA